MYPLKAYAHARTSAHMFGSVHTTFSNIYFFSTVHYFRSFMTILQKSMHMFGSVHNTCSTKHSFFDWSLIQAFIMRNYIFFFFSRHSMHHSRNWSLLRLECHMPQVFMTLLHEYRSADDYFISFRFAHATGVYDTSAWVSTDKAACLFLFTSFHSHL